MSLLLGRQSGVSSILANFLGHATESATLKGAGKLVESITGLAVETAALKGVGSLVDTITGHATESASLKGAGRLIDAITGQATETALLKASGKLISSSTGHATETGNLKAAGKLVGSSLGHATETALLKAAGSLVDSILGHATETASLKAAGKLIGSSLGHAIETGTLLAGSAFSASITGHATETANLKAAGKLASSLVGLASESAILKGTGRLIDSLTGQASIIGSLTNGSAGETASHIIGHATEIGVLKGSGRLFGSFVGQATELALLSAIGAVSAPIVGYAIETGSLLASGSLFDNISGSADVSGTLHNTTSSGMSLDILASSNLAAFGMAPFVPAPLQSFGSISAQNPSVASMSQAGKQTFMQSGISFPITPSADGWSLLGQKYMPGRLLILPSNGTLSGSIYVVSLSGTGRVPASAVNAAFNIRLNENYFSETGLVRADTIVELNPPISFSGGDEFTWSVVTRLSGNGRGNGILNSSFFVTVNGIAYPGMLSSSFNSRVEPFVQLSAEVEFMGTINSGDSFSAEMTQFSLRRA